MDNLIGQFLAPSKERIAAEARLHANLGTWDGQSMTTYYMGARRTDYRSGARMLFTRDELHHESGWWKNPDYERCYHLSLSFFDPANERVPRSPEPGEAEEWVDLFFRNDKRFIWEESPHSAVGKVRGVRHYRVFCNVLWQPIIPEGEVYTTLKTELGWKSWSEKIAADDAARKEYASE